MDELRRLPYAVQTDTAQPIGRSSRHTWPGTGETQAQPRPGHVTEGLTALLASLARRSSQSLVSLSVSQAGLTAALCWELSLVARGHFRGVVDPGTSRLESAVSLSPPPLRIELSLPVPIQRVFGSTVCVRKERVEGDSLGWIYTPETKENQTKGVPKTGWVPTEASATFYVTYFPVLFDDFY